MNDLEITRLCAEAMGIKIYFESRDVVYYIYHPMEEILPLFHSYNPLHDDAQAMELVKRCGLTIGCTYAIPVQLWIVTGGRGKVIDVSGNDLNRAICECAAKIEAIKVEADKLGEKS